VGSYSASVIEIATETLIKVVQIRGFTVCPSVALHHSEHYNARAQRRPAWKVFTQNATCRRLAEGRGVFVAGGTRDSMTEADETSGASSSSPPGGRVVKKVLLAQTGVTLALAALFWGFDGLVSGYSALLGGLTAVIPNGFLAARLMLPRRDPGAGALLRAAYLGELGKLVLTVLMFGAVFVVVEPLAAGALFSGFVAAQIATFAGFMTREASRGDNRHGKGAGAPGTAGNKDNG
jgi:ATP synthase protein I